MRNMLPGLDKIGCGYDQLTQDTKHVSLFKSTTEAEAIAEGATTWVLGVEYLCPSNVWAEDNVLRDNDSSYGDSVQEYKSSYASENDLQVGYKGQSMSARFGIDESSDQSSENSYSTISERIEQFKLTVTNADRAHLTDQAKIDIDQMPASDLFARYGTHVLVSARVGGLYEVNVRVAKSSSFTREEITAGVKAKASAMGLKVDGASSWDSVDEAFQSEIEGKVKSHAIGGSAANDLETWRASIDAMTAVDVISMDLKQISELAEGPRKAELEDALDDLLHPGQIGTAGFISSLPIPPLTSPDEWVLFTTPIFFGQKQDQKQGHQAMLKISVPPAATEPHSPQWDVSASYLTVINNNGGTTYTDGRIQYAMIQRSLGQMVELDGKVDGGAAVDEWVSPRKADGTPVTAEEFAQWMIVVAPREVGLDEGGSKNSDNALIGYECKATRDDERRGWNVRASCLYRYSDDGAASHQVVLPVKTRCLMVRNDDPRDPTFYASEVHDGRSVVLPDGQHNDWMLLLSPVAMTIDHGSADVNRTKAILWAECTASPSDVGWTVSANCHVRTSKQQDGDPRDVGATCHYLLVRRRGVAST